MASVQDAGEIRGICDRLHGRRIDLLQVIGINALKSIRPGPDDLVGEVIEGSDYSDRILALCTDTYRIKIDLQRTGKVVWLNAPEPYKLAPGPMPTVRLITDGGGLDLIEPARTKRITVAVTDRLK